MSKKLEYEANTNYKVKESSHAGAWGKLGECPEYNVPVPSGAKKSDKFAYRFDDKQYTGHPVNPWKVETVSGKKGKSE